jgi:Kdo2-lipid IVA lauroyltransferase/acyltransferase
MDQDSSQAVAPGLPTYRYADTVKSPDASRPRGPSRLKNWTNAAESALVSAALALLTRLEPRTASNMMGRLFRTIGPLLPVTRVADANLRAALPELDARARRRVVLDMWENLGRTAGEFPHLANLPKDSKVGPGWEMVDEHLMIEQANRGAPAIFVSGHIGNWEMLPVACAAYGMPFSSVYRPIANGAINDMILGLRRRAMRKDVPMFPKGGQGARGSLSHLRNGGYLGMLVDQKMNDGIEARLFGLPAMTAPAVAALALRFRCPVIPGHVERIGPARFRLIPEKPLTLPNTGDRQADILQLTQMVNDCLERWIREQPHAWLWLHRRFPKHVVPKTTRPG